MTTQAGFIGKILFFSLILSIMIKYGGQLVALSPNLVIVLTMVLLPTVIVALTLGWQYQKY